MAMGTNGFLEYRSLSTSIVNACGASLRSRYGPQAEPHPNTDRLPYRGTSAGGGYSTVEDLLRFAMALQQYKLLSAKYTGLATNAQVQTPMNSGYGYGFTVRDVNGTSCYGHNGGGQGINGELEICPANGYVVAVLANMDPPAAERVAEFAVDRLPSK